MIGLEAHRGHAGRIVSHNDLIMVMRHDSVLVELGGLVLFRTGFAEMLPETKKQPDRQKLFDAARAIDGKLRQCVIDSGAVALISDNFGVEASPARPCLDDFHATRPLHAQFIQIWVYSNPAVI